MSSGKDKVPVLIKHNAMKMYGGVKIQLYAFLASSLVGASFMPQAALPPEKETLVSIG
jgi:hypothetical protein